jgi:hypothetical protein
VHQPPELDRPPPARDLSPLARKVVVVLLLVFGVQLWLTVGRSDFGTNLWKTLLVAAGLLVAGALSGRFFIRLLDRIRQPSTRARMIAATGIAIFATSYLIFTGWRQGRNFQPKWQDEQSYVIQFRMLAHGRLWYPKHELADFFDSFQVIVDPVYASMYFPGAGLWYAPAQLVRLPFWFMSALACGVATALLYLIVTEAIDGVSGALAVVMILALFLFRKVSLLIGGHPPMLMVELAMIFCYLRWRERTRDSRQWHLSATATPVGWSLAIGGLAGWGAIIRPLDALVVAIPVGIMITLDLVKRPLRAWLVTGACLVAAALPFLALQIVFNVGVTGKWYRTPFDHYADRDYPGTTIGFHEYDPARRPVSRLPQKQKYYDDFAVPAIKRHRPQNVIDNWLGGDLARALADGMPHRLMFILLPVGLLGLVTRPRWLAWLLLPAYVVAFSFYTWNLPHYAVIVAPAVILWVLLGARVLENAWPRLRPALATFLVLAILVLSLRETAEFNRLTLDEPFDPQGLRDVNEKLAALPRTPAVVLFRYDPKIPGDEEPVYNMQTAWPDDAAVIRAHDLGDRNVEIFRYYAARQPERMFYRYDRGTNVITPLGTARELANRQG